MKRTAIVIALIAATYLLGQNPVVRGLATNSVSFSSTPAFTGAALQTITLTGSVSSSTISGAVAGQTITFKICQDATGGRPFTWPTGFHGTITISTSAGTANASTCVVQSFVYDGSAYYAPGEVNQ